MFDRHARIRNRELTMLTLRGSGKPASAAKTTDDADRQRPPGDRLLLRFTYPDDIKGTSFLVWEHPGAEDERFLFLPALGRVRRIVGAEAQESFVGSDFTYEDMGGREFEDYQYTLLDGESAWKAPDGQSYPVYKLESLARDRSALYPRIVSLVHKDRFIVLQAEIFNKRAERQKVYDARKLSIVQGIWTVLDATMANEIEHTRTELQLTSAEYNVGLTPDHFSRRELERGAK